MMQRIARYTRLKKGCVEEYKQIHREIWPEVLDLIKKAGIKNYSIYLSGQNLFSYLEVDDWNRALDIIMEDSIGEKFQKYMAPCMDAPDPVSPWIQIEEIFHLD
jgi:L-rhamnose mutarotase